VPQVQGGKVINMGLKKTNDNTREPLKCLGCGEQNLLRNSPYRNDARKNIHNLQEASAIRYIGKSIHTINATLDGMQVDRQPTIVEIEGKIHNMKVSILIYRGAS